MILGRWVPPNLGAIRRCYRDGIKGELICNDSRSEQEYREEQMNSMGDHDGIWKSKDDGGLFLSGFPLLSCLRTSSSMDQPPIIRNGNFKGSSPPGHEGQETAIQQKSVSLLPQRRPLSLTNPNTTLRNRNLYLSASENISSQWSA